MRISLGEKPHEDMAWETCFSKKGLEGKAEGFPWKLLCSVLRIMYFLHALSWIIWESVMAERQFDSHKTHLVEVVRGSPRIFLRMYTCAWSKSDESVLFNSISCRP